MNEALRNGKVRAFIRFNVLLRSKVLVQLEQQKEDCWNCYSAHRVLGHQFEGHTPSKFRCLELIQIAIVFLHWEGHFLFIIGPKSVDNSFPIVSCDVRYYEQQLTCSIRHLAIKHYLFCHLQKSIYFSTSLSESLVLLWRHIKAADARMFDLSNWQIIWWTDMKTPILRTIVTCKCT